MKISSTLLPVNLALTLLIAACGGGGGSSTPATPTITLTPQLTSSNAVSLMFNAAIADGLAEDSRSVYLDLVNYATSIAGYTGAGYTAACSASGFVTVRFIDADNSNGLTIGDSWSYTYNNCRFAGSSSTLNGTIGNSVTAGAGGSPALLNNAWTATVIKTRNTVSTSAGIGTYTHNLTLPHQISVGSDNSLAVTVAPSNFAYTFAPLSGSGYFAYSFSSFTGSQTYTGSVFQNTYYTKSGTYYLTGTDELVNSGAAYTLQVTHPVSVSGIYQGSGVHSAPSLGSIKIYGGGSSTSSSTAPFTTILIDYNGDTITDATSTGSGLSTALTP